jgi:tRNA(Ile)-lysidine synthase
MKSEGRQERKRWEGGAGDSARRGLTRFARRLLREWRRLELPASGEELVVAVSGGADSTALLLALKELSEAGLLDQGLTVAHLDHCLRASAAEDAAWVGALARDLGLRLVSGRVDVGRLAAESADNLEQAARRARYEFLSGVAARVGAQLVLTAHTLDDQAETVLLRLMRGSGTEGLGGMEALRPLPGRVALARPLLGWARRAETEGYCRERGVQFRPDEMNADERFARVRVRKVLLPLMASFNGRIVEALARTGFLLREDARALSEEARRLLETASIRPEGEGDANGPSEKPTAEGESLTLPELRADVLRRAPGALRRRALRQWLERGRGDLRRLELVHLLAVESLLEGERGGRRIELPGGTVVERRRGRLRLVDERG